MVLGGIIALKSNYIKWLSDNPVDIYATVTLKKAILNNEGFWIRLTPELVSKTAWLLRDRLTKALVGKKRKIAFMPFVEGDGDLKRMHLHIAVEKPSEYSLLEFSDVFRATAIRLDWVYNEIDIREIRPKTQKRVVAYSLKEGCGAFLPEASYLPLID